MAEEPRYLLPRLSVNRPVSVVMLLAALLVVGAIAYSRIPVNLFPEGLQGQRLYLWTTYPNASPVEVEEKIARPIEEAVATISGVKSIRSNSQNNGCWTSVEFRQGVDMDRAYAELRDRMDRVMPELPDEVERVQLFSWNENDIPVLWMGATFPPGAEAHFLLETHLQPALQRLKGVGNVDLWGSGGQQVHIELDQARVSSHGIDIAQLFGRLSAQNFNLPGGHVLQGGKKIYVRSIGRFGSVEEIRQLVVDPQHRLRLGDIATVSLKEPRKEWVNRIDRRESVGIGIRRSSGGNIVEVSRAVRAALEELKGQPQLRGVDFQIFWDQGEHVTESIDNLKSSAWWGGAFAAMVLFFFLRALRMTLIITLAIPLSILVTIAALFFAGWSLNIATMMGLMLSMGMVVDNAIVIVENIYRKRQEGVEPRQASIAGAGEVGLAVTMATLTSVVVFLPLMLMSDEQEFTFWMLRIGVPVIVGLLASLFIALVFIPLAAQRLPAHHERDEPGIIRRARGWYLRGLEWTLRRRLDALLLMLLALASVQIPIGAMQRTDQQEGNRRSLYLTFDMPSGQSLAQADRFMSAVEDTLMNHRDAYHVKVIRTEFDNSRGEVELVFAEEEQRQWYAVAFDNLLEQTGLRPKAHLEYKEVVEDVKKRLELPAGIALRVNWEQESQDAALSLNLYGEDTGVLMQLAQEVERRLRSVPGLLSVTTDMDRGGTELQVRLNRDQVRRYGIDPQQISGTIAYALRGVTLSRFQTEDGRELDIRMQLAEGDRQSMQQLRAIGFKTPEGTEVPLESLASLYVRRTLRGIRREDRQTVLTVTVAAARDDMEKLFAQIDQTMQGFEMPRGYRWDKGARYVRLEEADSSQQFALVLSITFVFLLMGVLFESFVLPLSVIVSIPFSFFGVYWFLYLTGTPYDIMSMIGTVILIGVVVNNAIVLIDLANRLRAEGMDRHRALIEAGRHRFRPILMTSFTTICGLIPMAVGNTNMIGLPYAPLGRTMMGGLLASTVLTLLVVPLFYTFLDDLRQALRRLAASAVAGRRAV